MKSFPGHFRKSENRKTPSWWEEALSDEERILIEEAFRPMGSITARQMVESDNPLSIGHLIGHLKKEQLRHLGYKLIARADAVFTDDLAVRSRHFYLAAAGDFFYRWRDVDPFALESAVLYFERQIALGPEAAQAFLNDPEIEFIPAHSGYRQLRILEEKRGNFARARALCLKAKAEGWQDDWDKQIATLDKKIAKAGAS